MIAFTIEVMALSVQRFKRGGLDSGQDEAYSR